MRNLLLNTSLVAIMATSMACGSDDSSSSTSDPRGNPSSESETLEEGEAQPQNIAEVAIATGDFTQLVDALSTAGLVDAVTADGPLTVFAPTDAAFEAFEAENPGVLAGLSVEALQGILTYHVVSGEVLSGDLVDASIAPTLQGSYVSVGVGDSVTINDATVTAPDVMASNGVIHVVDSIILPPAQDIVETAVAAGSFNELADALSATGLVDVLQGEGPFTVFAPTDAAFEAFEAENPGVLASLSVQELSDILLYHVTPGWVGAADLTDGLLVDTRLGGRSISVDLSDGVRLNDSNVTQANILTTNGVIHVIDSILLPPSE